MKDSLIAIAFTFITCLAFYAWGLYNGIKHMQDKYLQPMSTPAVHAVWVEPGPQALEPLEPLSFTF